MRTSILSLLLITIGTTLAISEPLPPSTGVKSRIHLDLPLFYNPLGVTIYGGAWVSKVYKTSDYFKCDWSWIKTGATVNINPAYVQGGAYAEWAPTAVTMLRVRADAAQSFGRFGVLLDFPTREHTIADEDFAEHKGEESLGNYYRVIVQPKLQAQVGRFGGSADLRGVWYYRDGGRYFYEPEFVTLVHDRDFLLSHESKLFFEVIRAQTGRQILVGPSYGATAVRGGDRIHKIGAFGYWVMRERTKHLRDVRSYLSGGVFLVDRTRAGQGYAALGAGFDICLKE